MQYSFCLISQEAKAIRQGQLIEYNMRNIFLENSCTKCGGEFIPRPLSEKSNLSISVDQYSKVLCSLFFSCMPSWGYWNILKLTCEPLDFTSYKAFQKNK